MDTLTALTSRVSAPRLEQPGPTADQLQCLLKAALRAPDHGLLRPWRFIVLEGDQRARLGEIMERRLLREQPGADQSARDKARGKALRAPAIIIAVAEITEGHKVPAWEQAMAVGAAVENMMIAAHAMGIGAMWRTGAMANEHAVKRELGFQDKDRIVAFLYLGTPAGSVKNVPDEDITRYLRDLPR